MASSVWGLIPSLAATTNTTISVVFAPRALIEEKAAWPGVSIKVSLPLEVSTSYAPICWVIPPASSSTTFVFLMKSRRVVFPWSTWPITVITAGLIFGSSLYLIKFARSSSKFSCSIAIPLCPISSTTKIAVSWSITSFIVATTPSDIRFLTTSPPLTAINFASSPTLMVSGISMSFFINSVGASNWCWSSKIFSSFFLNALTALDSWSLTSTFSCWDSCLVFIVFFFFWVCFSFTASFSCSCLLICCSFNCSEAAALFASILSE